MNRRIGFVTVVVAALVLIAGCSAPLQVGTGTATAETDSAGTDRTVSTTGVGEATAEADLAVVTVAVTARGDSADAVREAVAADTARMRDALRAAGVEEDAVRTVSFRLSPRSAVDESGTRSPAGYEAVHAFSIETTPDAAGEVVDTAIGNGASEVYGVAFTLSDDARADLREQALERAMADSRADADVVAAAADLSVTGVRSVSIGGDYGPIYAVRESAADAGGAGTQFDAGPVTVHATVDVTYAVA